MKNVVITGSTRGIGFSMAREFLQAGCNVMMSGRGEALAEAVNAELSTFNGRYILLTDFITKTPDGDPSEVISDENLKSCSTY